MPLLTSHLEPIFSSFLASNISSSLDFSVAYIIEPNLGSYLAPSTVSNVLYAFMPTFSSIVAVNCASLLATHLASYLAPTFASNFVPIFTSTLVPIFASCFQCELVLLPCYDTL